MHDLIVIIAFTTMLLAPCVSAAFIHYRPDDDKY